MYKNFEETTRFYELNDKLGGKSEEILEFNRNMELVYAGRKAFKNDKNPCDYVVRSAAVFPWVAESVSKRGTL